MKRSGKWLFIPVKIDKSYCRKSQAENFIKMAAKLIAPAIESNFHAGYDWCIEQVKMSSFHELAHDLEIDKAVMYLKQRDFHQVCFSSIGERVRCFIWHKWKRT